MTGNIPTEHHQIKNRQDSGSRNLGNGFSFEPRPPASVPPCRETGTIDPRTLPTSRRLSSDGSSLGRSLIPRIPARAGDLPPASA